MPKKLSGKEIGESAFCIIYLLFLVVTGIISLLKKEHTLFIMILLLGVGDSFHLIPRIKKNLKGDFPKSDFYLGLGSQISSITMTLFYYVLFLLMGYGFLNGFNDYFFTLTPSLSNTLKAIGESTVSFFVNPRYELLPSIVIYLTLIRIILCLFPNNNWYKKEGNQVWAVIRNIPFVLIGAITVYSVSTTIGFDFLSILIILSFLFYIPVALFAKKNPKLGMLMIPKTICYILMITYFL